MFIDANKYEAAVRAIVENDEEVRMAVAFWGKGAAEIVAARNGRPTQIVCNLAMGGTNPGVVEQLMKMKGMRVKQDDRLHAKVVIGSSSALVGSANMSTNGLSLEGPEVTGWNEAGLRTRKLSEVTSIGAWFDHVWAAARRIKSTDIADARALWLKRRCNRPLQRGGKATVGFSLKNAKAGSLADRPIYFAIYRKNRLSPEAEAVRQSAVPSLGGEASPKSVRIDYYAYEGWDDLPRDTDAEIINIHYRRNGTIKCLGATRRIEKRNRRVVYEDGEVGHIALAMRISTIAGRPFGPRERVALAAEIEPYIYKIWSDTTQLDEDADGVAIVAADMKRFIVGRKVALPPR